MGRASVQIVIFLICLNAVGGMLTMSGVADDIGIEPDIGADKQVNQTKQNASSLSPSQGSRGTLFGAFISAASTLANVWNLVFYGPRMIANLGIPFWMTSFPFAAAIIIVGKDIIYVVTGRDL